MRRVKLLAAGGNRLGVLVTHPQPPVQQEQRNTLGDGGNHRTYPHKVSKTAATNRRLRSSLDPVGSPLGAG